MPLVLADRVRDTTTTTGTGTITLSGTAPTGYQNFSVIGNGNTTYYTINAGSQWEVGIGTYSSTGPTLARTTVLESSNGGALVNFSAGVKDVFVTYPADKSVNYDENNNVGIGTTSPVAKLDVRGTSFFNSDMFTYANGGIFFSGNGSYNVGLYARTADLVFQANGSERMRIDSIGNVGIGTSSPGGSANDRQLTLVGLSSAQATFSAGGVANSVGTTTSLAYLGPTSNHPLGFFTNNTERMRVTAAGLVGIGTSSPGALLHVQSGNILVKSNSDGSNGILRIENTAGNTAIQSYTDVNQGWFGVVEAKPLSLLTNNTRRMTITGAGDVGIGTTSPGARLDVSDAGTGFVSFAPANASTSLVMRLGYATDFSQITADNFGGNLLIGADESNTKTNSFIAFRTDATERMRVTSAGDVGVGTSSPTTKLHVSQFGGIGATIDRVGDFGPSLQLIRQGVSGSAAFGLALDNTLGIYTANTERMRVTTSGNVGIGTTSADYRLTVAGASTAGSVTALAIENPSTNAASEVRQEWRAGGSSWGYITTSYNSNAPFMAFGVSAASSSPTERMRLNSAGHLGLGVTPSASTEPLLQMQNGGMLATAGPYAHYMANAFFGAGGWTYTTSAAATRYEQGVGIHSWHTAPSGTAGNAITFTQAMTLDTQTAGRSTLTLNNSSQSLLSLAVGGSRRGYLLQTSTEMSLFNEANGALFFGTNAAERMRIDGNGNVMVGFANANARFNILQSLSGTYGSAAAWITDNATTSLLLNNVSAGVSAMWASGNLAFGSGSNNFSERMRITGAGNVGINISNPSVRLSVLGDPGDPTLNAASGIAEFRLSSTQMLAIGGYGSGSFGVWLQGKQDNGGYTNNTWPIILQPSGGNVGIGTASPATRLQVETGADATAITCSAISSTSSQLRLGIGGFAAGVPSITGTGNGLSLVASDAAPMRFGTSNTERMRIDSSGLVGIGTSSPTIRLQVTDVDQATARIGVRNLNGQNYQLVAGNPGASNSGFAIFDATASATRMYLDSSGNLLLGTTTTTNTGQVISTAGANFSSTATKNSNMTGLTVSATTNESTMTGVWFATGNAAHWSGIAGARTNHTVDWSTHLAFYTHPADFTNIDSAFERMRIDGAGNLGLGMTPAPISGFTVFDVNGNAGGGGGLINWRSAGVRVGTAYASGQGALVIGTAPAVPMVFITNSTETMRIQSSGNVGIGTSSPGNRLHVVGNIQLNTTSDTMFTNNIAVVSSAADMLLNASSAAIRFNAGGTERMRITSGGQLLVGTTSPSAILPAGSIQYVAGAHITSGNFGRIWVPGQAIGSATFAGLFGMASTYNAYFSGGWRSIGGGTASAITIDEGRFSFSNSNSVGAADAALTWTTRLMVDTNGNVGVGTSSPNTRFKVYGNTGNNPTINNTQHDTTGNSFDYASVSATSNTGSVGLTSWASGSVRGGTGWVQTVGAIPLVVGVNDTEVARFTTAGNVGIGTTAPNKLLTLNSPTNDVEVLRINAPGGPGGVQGRADIGFGFFDTVAEANAAVGFEEFGTSSAGGSLLFKTRPDGAAFETRPTERMRIDPNGNVGIGTTSPSSRLQVNDGFVAFNSRDANGYPRFTATEASAQIGFFRSGSSAGGGYIGANSDASFIAFSGALTERMRIDTSGNVGIGTSSPGARLETYQTSGGTNAIRMNTNFAAGNFVDLNPSISGVSNGGFSIALNGTIRQVISVGGNVGIGTTSPGARLDVAGNIIARTGNDILDTGAIAGAAYVQSYNNTSGIAAIPLLFYTGTAERARIDSSGNFMVGTTSALLPASGRGNITINGSSTAILTIGVGGSSRGWFYADATNTYLTSVNNLIFEAGGANERFRITSTGAITSSDLADAVGYKGIPQNARTSSYTLALSDIGRHISITTGGVTIPANGSVAFPIGSAITIYNNSASNQTISITSDTLRLAGTATTGSRTLAQRGICTCVKVAATEWVISGAGLT